MKMRPFFFIAIFAIIFVSAGCNHSGSSSSSSGAGGNTAAAAQATLKLSWNATLGEQQGFYIEQSPDGVTFKPIQTVPDGTNSATVTVSTGATYYFRIRGYNQAGDSPYTSVTSVTAN